MGKPENLEALFEDAENGIMHSIKEDCIVVDHSPRRTEYARNLKEKLFKEKKVSVLDAPIHDENNSLKH